MGIFQGKRRKELQGQIVDKKQQIENLKQRLGNIVRGYGYSSVMILWGYIIMRKRIMLIISSG